MVRAVAQLQALLSLISLYSEVVPEKQNWGWQDGSGWKGPPEIFLGQLLC